MEAKQNPFSIYDFLGYFTPGALFLYASMAVYGHAQTETTLVDFISKHLSFEKPEIYIPFVLIAYSIGHVLSFLSSAIIEKYSIWAIGYPSRYLLALKCEGYYSTGDKHKKLRKVIRTLVALMILPIALFDVLVGRMLGYRELYAKPLDALLINIIKAKTSNFLQENSGLNKPPPNSKNADFFRFIYHYTVEHAPNHLPKMQNYVALYGFLRTLTLLAIISFWGIVWHIATAPESFCMFLSPLIITIILSVILYMAFVKFYRRFSLESLMALTSIYHAKKIVAPKEVK